LISSSSSGSTAPSVLSTPILGRVSRWLWALILKNIISENCEKEIVCFKAREALPRLLEFTGRNFTFKYNGAFYKVFIVVFMWLQSHMKKPVSTLATKVCRREYISMPTAGIGFAKVCENFLPHH
jgi:hypothetical protein